MSGHSCGCDPEAGWVAEHCKGPEGCLSRRCKPAALANVDAHQPAPRANERCAIQDLVIADLRTGSTQVTRHAEPRMGEDTYARVIADIQARKEIGLQRYGTLLQAFNGRDALLDAYQEALDLCQYLRQVKEEGVTWIDVTYNNALLMMLHLRDVIEDRTNEAARVTALGDPARGD